MNTEHPDCCQPTIFRVNFSDDGPIELFAYLCTEKPTGPVNIIDLSWTDGEQRSVDTVENADGTTTMKVTVPRNVA